MYVSVSEDPVGRRSVSKRERSALCLVRRACTIMSEPSSKQGAATEPETAAAIAPKTELGAEADSAEPKTLGEALTIISALRAEVAELNAQLEATRAPPLAAAPPPAAPPQLAPPAWHAPPPTTVPPPASYPAYDSAYAGAYASYGAYAGYGNSGYTGSYGYPNYAAQPAPPVPPPRPRAALAINADNKRGPRGSNLCLLCIPNAYTDSEVYELCKPYGNLVFCSVATHRDTGMSRGYAFISYATVAEANVAQSALHSVVIDGRHLRCELTRQDRDGASRPY
jgi:hypothetical protein